MVETPDYCIIRDTPDAEICKKDKYTTVTVAYTFSFPDSGSFVFDLPMCVDHATAMKFRVEQDLTQTLKRKA